jgi:hypothetical protein
MFQGEEILTHPTHLLPKIVITVVRKSRMASDQLVPGEVHEHVARQKKNLRRQENALGDVTGLLKMTLVENSILQTRSSLAAPRHPYLSEHHLIWRACLRMPSPLTKTSVQGIVVLDLVMSHRLVLRHKALLRRLEATDHQETISNRATTHRSHPDSGQGHHQSTKLT